MKTCPACSAENNADGKFCSACGGALVPGPEATVDHNPAKNVSAFLSISDPDSSAHGRFLPGTKIADRYPIGGQVAVLKVLLGNAFQIHHRCRQFGR